MLGESEASSSSADLKDGLETFFAKQAVSPLGSPCLDEVHGSRHGSFSSTSSVSRSREDVRETKQNIKVDTCRAGTCRIARILYLPVFSLHLC